MTKNSFLFCIYWNKEFICLFNNLWWCLYIYIYKFKSFFIGWIFCLNLNLKKLHWMIWFDEENEDLQKTKMKEKRIRKNLINKESKQSRESLISWKNQINEERRDYWETTKSFQQSKLNKNFRISKDSIVQNIIFLRIIQSSNESRYCIVFIIVFNYLISSFLSFDIETAKNTKKIK